MPMTVETTSVTEAKLSTTQSSKTASIKPVPGRATTSTTKKSTNTSTTSFKLKAGLHPLTVFELVQYDRQNLENDLNQKISEAPQFFQQVPVILSTDHYEGHQDDINLSELKQLCAGFGLILVALRGGSKPLQLKALELSMGLIPAKSTRGDNKPPPEQNKEVRKAWTTSKIITTPIRSGQQVYAAEGDLIVIAPVSAGAEILADGNIHVYGPVRGRILAGVKGDVSARVFCQSLEAELISIAGHYTTEEDSSSQYWKQAVQIHLSEGVFCFAPLLPQP